jgi:hypothetical protein
MTAIKLLIKILYDVARYGRYKNYENLKRIDLFALIFCNISIFLPNFLLDRKVCAQKYEKELCYINKPLNISDETWRYLSLFVIIVSISVLVKLIKVYRGENKTQEVINTSHEAEGNLAKVESNDSLEIAPKDKEIVILNTLYYDKNNEPYYLTYPYGNRVEKNHVSDFFYGGISFRRGEWSRRSFSSILTFSTIIIVTVLVLPFPILSLIILLPITFVFLRITKKMVDIIYLKNKDLSNSEQDIGIDTMLPKFIKKLNIFISLSFYEIYDEVKSHFIVKLSVFLAWAIIIFLIMLELQS